MASVFKRGRRYSCRLRIGGSDIWRSLHTTNRDEALRKAAELEAAANGRQWVRRQFDELTARAEREVHPDEAPVLCESLLANLRRLLHLVPAESRDPLAAKLSRSLLAAQNSKVALNDGWNVWVASPRRATQPKPKTLESYAGIWRRFAAWAASNRLEWFHEFDEKSALAYGASLWSSSMTPRTFNVHVWFLRNVWTVLRVEAGTGKENPWDAIPAKTGGSRSGRRAFTEAELSLIMQEASGSLRLLLLVGALTGARLGDVVNMRWDALDLGEGIWSLTPMKTARLGKSLKLPLLQPLLDALKEWKQTDAGLRLFVFDKERDEWKRNDLSKTLSAHFAACGIVTNTEVGKGENRRRARIDIGFHSLRHSVATIAAKNGSNLGLVQRVLGHSTEAMTQHYTHGDADSARGVLAPMAEIVTGAFARQRGAAAAIGGVR